MNHVAGKKHTAETRAKQSAAHRGKVLTPEHRAKIAQSMRAAHARGHGAHDYLRAMSQEERADYEALTKGRYYRRAEALRSIGRPDLIGLHKAWHRFLSSEEAAEFRELRGRHGASVTEALEAIGRLDLIE